LAPTTTGRRDTTIDIMSGANLLLVYHSGEGQTTKIADRIAEVLRAGGAAVTQADADHAPAPTGFDGAIVGDSIHLGRHSRELTRYLGDNREALAQVPLALFQVSLTSADDDEGHTTEAQAMLHRLIDGTGIDPDLVGLFAGALAYTRYGWLKRRLMRRIAAGEDRPTDTSQDHEFTDWEAVDHFASDALALMTGP
jgi:menaquinone-dependent protoporphyrinogen oxidase